MVRTVIERPRAEVWALVRPIERHAEWMADAVAIRFTSSVHDAVGTTFDCDTKVGPFSLTDHMEVTEWVEGRVMGVRHVGVVTGTGRFTLVDAPGGGTVFSWDERLEFPWWMGGRPGGFVGSFVLRAVWRRNLRTLRALAMASP